MWFFKKRGHRQKFERDVRQIQGTFSKDLETLEELLELSKKKKEIFSELDRLWSKRWKEAGEIIRSLIPIIDNQLRFLNRLKERYGSKKKIMADIINLEKGMFKNLKIHHKKEIRSALTGFYGENFDLLMKKLDEFCQNMISLLTEQRSLFSRDDVLDVLNREEGQKREDVLSEIDFEIGSIESHIQNINSKSREIEEVLQKAKEGSKNEVVEFADDFEIVVDDDYGSDYFKIKLTGPMIDAERLTFEPLLKIDPLISDRLRLKVRNSEELGEAFSGNFNEKFNENLYNRREDYFLKGIVFKIGKQDIGKLLRSSKKEMNISVQITTSFKKEKKDYVISLNLLRDKIMKIIPPEDFPYECMLAVRVFDYEHLDSKRYEKSVVYGSPARPSVHFTLNHWVISHSYGDWDDKDAAILVPFLDLYEANKKNFYGGSSVDIFFIGFIKLPKSTVLLRKKSGESDGQFRKRVSQTIVDLGYPLSRGGEWSDEMMNPVFFRFMEERGLTHVAHTQSAFGSGSYITRYYEGEAYEFCNKRLKKLLKSFGVKEKLTKDNVDAIIDKIGVVILSMYLFEMLNPFLKTIIDEYRDGENLQKFEIFMNAWFWFWVNRLKKKDIPVESIGFEDDEKVKKIISKALLYYVCGIE